MSEPPSSEHDATPPPVSDAVDAACDRFEAAWDAAQAGETRPCIEDYLTDVPQAEQTQLLLELVLLDLHYRGKAGDPATVEDYLARFPFLDGERLDRQLRRLERTGPAPSLGAVPRTLATDGGAGRPRSAAVLTVAIPGYEVLDELGKGGMGIVYRARQIRLDRLVALKVILARGHAGDEERRRFQVEAEAVARLKHPNVVQIYEVGEQDGLPFFSMEYCEGGSLDTHLDGTPWEPARAAVLVDTLARATHCAHQAGIVHRDLKPANVLLAADGTPKVTDFGLAKRLDASAHTQTGAVMGTPPYMAPEQASAKKSVGPAADVWALGVLLYELLVGRPPFKAATPLDTVLQLLSDEPVAVRRLQPKVPRDLETICHKCLHKDARKRYASAQALADDLKHFLVGEPIRARRVRPWERAAKWVRRRPAAAALIAILVVIGLAGPVLGLLYAAQQIHQEKEKRLEQERSDILAVAARGQTAAESRDWDKAEELLKEALVRVDAEPHLEALRAHVKKILDPVQRRLAARAAHRHFLRDRDDALFHATLASGADAPNNLRIARAKAEAALAAVGFSPDGRGALRQEFTPEEKEEIIAGTYALLLMLAETEARQRRPGLALALLDRAEALGVRTRALHLRRARYLNAQDKAAAAQAEEKRAHALEGRADLHPQDAFLVGLELYNQGQVDKATAEFRRALQRMPDDFWNHYFLGICCVRSKKADEAVTLFTICQKQQPKLVWVYLLRGFALGQMKNYAAAEEDFARALEFTDLTEAARYVLLNNRGVMRLGQEDKAAWEKGIDDLKEAAALRPEQYQARATLALAFGLRHQLEEAGKHVDLAIARAEQQARAGNLRPAKLALLYHSRARLHLERKDREAALRDLAEAAQLAGNDGSLAARMEADRGLVLHSQKRFDEALRAYDAALKMNSAYVDVLRWRGEVLLVQGKWAEAAAAFDAYLHKGGTVSAAIYRQRALARVQLGRHAEAVEDYGRALDATPKADERVPLCLARGQEYLALNALQPALRDFEEVLGLAPDDADARLGRAHIRVKLGDTEKGVADADRAVKGEPPSKEPRLWHGAARVYAQAAAQMQIEQGSKGSQAWLQSRYQERAVVLLRRALVLVPAKERTAYWREKVLTDPALYSLQHFPPFVWLASRVMEQDR
jgi:tetratricopeptide (TPR) repeat protein/predicted Ser/Thr protein kinase